jgi:hypothetical protein
MTATPTHITGVRAISANGVDNKERSDNCQGRRHLK